MYRPQRDPQDPRGQRDPRVPQDAQLVGVWDGRPVYMLPTYSEGNHARPPPPGRRVARHPTINLATFSQDLVRKRNTFKATHIAETFTRTAPLANPQEKLNRLQIQTLTSPIPDCWWDLGFAKQMIVAWFDIFNSLFFGGGMRDLRDRIDFGPVAETDPGAPFRPRRFGQFAGGGRDNHGSLHINSELDPDPGVRREEAWIKTLLHEMVHGFIGYYRCECGACQAVDHPSQGGDGKWDGHGPAWTDSLLAIGQAVQDLVPWDFTEVGLVPSTQQCMEYYNWQPTEEQCTRWGFYVAQGIPGGIIRGRQRPQPQPILRSPPGSPPGRYRGPGARDPDGHSNQDEDDEAQLQAAIAESLRDRAPPRRSSGARHPQDRGQDRPSMAELEDAFTQGYNEGYDHGAANRVRDPPQPRNGPRSEIEAALARGYNEGYDDAVLRRGDGRGGGGGGGGGADEDEELRRALEASRLDAGRNNRPRTPRPRDPYEDATRALVEQLQRENGGGGEVENNGEYEDYEEDYEDANERLIRRMMEEDIARGGS